MIVSVQNIPVRYDGKTYMAGEEFSIEDQYYNEKIMTFIRDEVIEMVDYTAMTKDEIKAELDKQDIAYNTSDNKEALLHLLTGGRQEA